MYKRFSAALYLVKLSGSAAECGARGGAGSAHWPRARLWVEWGKSKHFSTRRSFDKLLASSTCHSIHLFLDIPIHACRAPTLGILQALIDEWLRRGFHEPRKNWFFPFHTSFKTYLHQRLMGVWIGSKCTFLCRHISWAWKLFDYDVMDYSNQIQTRWVICFYSAVLALLTEYKRRKETFC